jgi:transposase
MASTSGKRCTLSIEQKLEILEVLKSKKADDVAKDFNIGYSTVKKIRQNEEEIRKIVMNNGNLSRKRKRESPNEEIGEALYYDIEDMIEKNVSINRTQRKITDFFK